MSETTQRPNAVLQQSNSTQRDQNNPQLSNMQIRALKAVLEGQNVFITGEGGDS